jgi:hypothetical protein
MAVHHATARKLATEAEWTLLQSSYGTALTSLSPARLKQKIVRARALRDKYRALAQQQRGEARGKRKSKRTRAAQGNANTKTKAAMFAEALGRFQGHAAEVKASPAKKRQPAKKSAKRASAKKTAKKASAKRTTKQSSAKRTVKKSSGKRVVRKKRPLAFAPPVESAAPANPWAAFVPPSELSLKAQSKASRGARKRLKFSHQSASAHQAHVGSRARRNQAKRDTR